jgi:calcium-dependent protein kinase
LRDTFIALDKDGSGSIELTELEAGLGHRENAETLISLLKAADTDNSGSIDYTEFLAAAMDQQTYMRNDYMRTAFNMFDMDGSGSIEREELIQILQSEDMAGVVPKDQLIKYMSEVDTNGDGEIDFEEF